MGKSRNIKSTKIVFFGTPDYVVPILEVLYKYFKTKENENPIAAVATQPPSPAGREKKLTYSPVDKWAYSKKIPVFYDLKKLKESDIEKQLGILASFSKIIPKEVIDIFPKGILNIHPSLLPKYRGASPVQAAIASGDKETGVSIIKLDNILDHGDIVCQFKEKIEENDTTETLRKRLFEKSAQVLLELLPAYLDGKINLKKQNDKEAVFCKEIKKDWAFIDSSILAPLLQGKSPREKTIEIQFIVNKKISANSKNVNNLIRAMYPWPCVWTLVRLTPQDSNPKRLKIIKSHLEEKRLVLDEVQLEGKNKVSWEQFREGYPQNSLLDY